MLPARALAADAAPPGSGDSESAASPALPPNSANTLAAIAADRGRALTFTERALLLRAVRSVCTPDVRSVLMVTCTLPERDEPVSLGALRAALVRDAAGLVERPIKAAAGTNAEVFIAAAQGELRGLLRALDERAGGGASVDAATVAALTTLVELAEARDERAFRAAVWHVLGVGPWSDPWTLDAHASVPRLQSGDFLINGDAALGYSQERFGGLARGSLYSYELKNADGQLTRTERLAGSGEGSLSLRASDTLRVDVRLAGGGSQYTTLNVADAGIGKQQSTIGFGGFLAGVRADPSPLLSLAAHAGLGIQAEQFKQTDLTLGTGAGALASGGIGVNQSSPVTVRGELRVAGDWAALPQVLSLRVRAEAIVSSISRTDTVTTVSGLGVQSASSAATVKQLEVYARGYVVVDALGVFGFFPAVHAGVNYVTLLSGGGEPVVVPVLGFGVRREGM